MSAADTRWRERHTQHSTAHINVCEQDHATYRHLALQTATIVYPDAGPLVATRRFFIGRSRRGLRVECCEHQSLCAQANHAIESLRLDCWWLSASFCFHVVDSHGLFSHLSSVEQTTRQHSHHPS